MLNVHRERLNPVKNHSKALVFFAVSKQIPIVYSADRGRAENIIRIKCIYIRIRIINNKSLQIVIN